MSKTEKYVYTVLSAVLFITATVMLALFGFKADELIDLGGKEDAIKGGLRFFSVLVGSGISSLMTALCAAALLIATLIDGKAQASLGSVGTAIHRFTRTASAIIAFAFIPFYLLNMIDSVATDLIVLLAVSVLSTAAIAASLTALMIMPLVILIKSRNGK